MRTLLAFAVVLTLLVGALWLASERADREGLARDTERAVEAREGSESRPAPALEAQPSEPAPDAPVRATMLTEFEAARSPLRDVPVEPGRMPRVTLAGRVTNWDGSPAAGARVELECSAPFRSRLAPLAFALAAADGSFQLSGPGSGPFRVAARLGLARVERDELVGGDAGLELVLPVPCTLRLRVVDDRGLPVESFSVSRKPVAENRAASSDGQGLVRGEHGALELAGLTPGGWHVHVESPGSCAQEVVLTLPAQESSTIVLPRVARVTGRVLDERGEPVPNAEVGGRVELDSTGWLIARRTCACDVKGSFTLSLPPGPTVEITARRGKASGVPRTVTLGAGQELELDLGPLFDGPAPLADGALERAALSAGLSASVSGRVTDASGAPLARVSLYAYPPEGPPVRIAFSDEHGAYRLELAPGRFRVQARVNASEGAFQVGEQFVRLERGESRAGFDFALESAAVIAGWVRYPPGWKDGNAQILVRDGAPDSDRSVVADEHGRFRVAPLGAGPHWVSAIGRDGLGRACCTARTFEVEATAGQAASIALELVPATVLSVRPAEGTEMPREAVFEVVDPSGLTRPAQIDGDGRWKFVLSAHDPALLRARYRGRSFERELSLSPGDVELDFRLE